MMYLFIRCGRIRPAVRQLGTDIMYTSGDSAFIWHGGAVEMPREWIEAARAALFG